MTITPNLIYFVFNTYEKLNYISNKACLVCKIAIITKSLMRNSTDNFSECYCYDVMYLCERWYSCDVQTTGL